MKINCLGCGFKVDLNQCYDDYEGQIKCYACGVVMEITTRVGEIQAVKLAAVAPAPLAAKAFARRAG